MTQNSILKEGQDYYLDENGLMVFTEEYHLKRGFCCKSGCKHCPFGVDHSDSDIPSELKDPWATQEDLEVYDGEIEEGYDL